MTNDNEVPDFSRDDFANDKYIIKSRAERQKYKQMVEDSLSIIRNTLNAKNCSDEDPGSFLMFEISEPTVNKSLVVVNPSYTLHIILAEYYSSYVIPKGHNAGTDEYLFGYFTTKQKFPRTYIHKESIKEKIADLLLKQDVDFKNSKTFSRSFHVVSENGSMLQDMLQFKDLDILAKHTDMEVEFKDSTCLFRNSKKPVSPEEATDFCELAKALVKVFS